MAEPVKKMAVVPLDPGLLSRTLSAESPDLESSDERLEKVNGLTSRNDYAGAARAAEALLREGVYDVRLVGAYLLGLFLEGGLQAMPAVFHALSNTLLRNWQFFGPRERRDVFADGNLRWLLKLLIKHIEFHERSKDETWQRWREASNREALEQALALSEEIFASFGQAMPRNGCEAPFRRLTQWMEGHLMSLPAAQPEPEEEPAPEHEPEEAEPEVAQAPRKASPQTPVREAGPTVPVSPAMAELMRKLAAFDTLVQRQDFQRASVVAADVMAVVERFDPRVYLPSLFSRFFAGLSVHAEQVESLLQGTESLSFRALDQLYRVDLETFLASAEGAHGAEK
ncbi:type VI secretion system protein IglI family protein [Stigmatella erecta]|uniref:ImpA N-terminal domain-containing protein n=1 Tax=Stigmatella erecta TaxID=83460 RepID=A0A1I0I2C2_9BACT|nr:type VI secretion system protein IglI family protein [Stigmatella erecta]SET90613.1 hypothetical protein SAMN05443639_105255 [Stigmatella erecta]